MNRSSLAVPAVGRRALAISSLAILGVARSARAQSSCQPLLPVNAVTSMSAIRAVEFNCIPNVCPAGQVAQGVDVKGNALGCVPLTGVVVASATALAVQPSTCAAGQYFGGINVYGDSLGCTAVPSAPTVPTTYYGTAEIIAGIQNVIVGGLTFYPPLPGGTTNLTTVEVYPVNLTFVIRAGDADEPTATSSPGTPFTGTNPIAGLYKNMAMTDGLSLSANSYGAIVDFMIKVTLP